MHENEPKEPPEHTSEHVKSQNFLGACPPDPPHTIFFCGAPLFVFALGPPNPLGDPGCYYMYTATHLLSRLHADSD